MQASRSDRKRLLRKALPVRDTRRSNALRRVAHHSARYQCPEAVRVRSGPRSTPRTPHFFLADISRDSGGPWMTNPLNEPYHHDPQQWFDRFETYPSSRTALNLAGAYRKMVVGIDDVTVEATIDQV